ncbi:uncharacterized protein [Montipora capricornis]|uniref:uncharacterized protein n=1 Tax=Montipora capricornis TaxID=246305 RepID=UPI0035F1E131
MATKLFLVLILAYCANKGLCFECNECFGDDDECNNSTAKNQTCEEWQDKCFSMRVIKDGRKTRVYGCASQKDCDAGEAACRKTEAGRTTCESACCAGERCNMPPVKDDRLMCYTCHSASSMDDCTQKSIPMPCEHGETKCGQFTAELMNGDHKIMVYRKGCRSEDACDKNKDLFGQGCGSDGSECDFSCCSEDLCNSGFYSTASSIMLIASTVFSFISFL